MRKLPLTLLFFFFFLSSYCQEKPNFDLISAGEIPEKLILTDEEKVIRFKDELLRGGHLSPEQISGYVQGSVRHHNYLVNTGQLSFGNDIQKYLDSLVQFICHSVPELQEMKFDVFLSHEATVNAFCYFHKEIHVNLGLLAHLESEGELVFVLCHEIAHYLLEHSNKRISHSIGEQAKTKKKRIVERTISQLLKSLEISREHELEADAKGVEIMNKIGYSSEEAYSALQKLFYSDQSYFQYSNVLDQLFSNKIMIPEAFKPQEIIEIQKNTDYFDKYHTHPNIHKRLKAIKQSSGSSENRESTLKFKKIQFASRLLHLKSLFLNKEYVRVLHNSTYLINKYPAYEKEFKKFQAFALFAIAKFKHNNLLGSIILPINKTPGYEQELTYFFKQSSKEQITAVAIKFISEVNKDYSNDKFNYLIQNLITDLNPKVKTNLFSESIVDDTKLKLFNMNTENLSEEEVFEIQLKLSDYWKYNWPTEILDKIKSQEWIAELRNEKVKVHPIILLPDEKKQKKIIEKFHSFSPGKKDSVLLDMTLSNTFLAKPNSVDQFNLHKNRCDWILQASQNEGLFQPLLSDLKIFNFEEENVLAFVIAEPYEIFLHGKGFLIIHHLISIRKNLSADYKEFRLFKKSMDVGFFHKKYASEILKLN